MVNYWGEHLNFLLLGVLSEKLTIGPQRVHCNVVYEDLSRRFQLWRQSQAEPASEGFVRHAVGPKMVRSIDQCPLHLNQIDGISGSSNLDLEANLVHFRPYALLMGQAHPRPPNSPQL
jgi:hypothetical protein